MGPSPPSTGQITTGADQGFGKQTGANIAAQYGSQLNQSNPYGNLNYIQTGVGPNGAPQYTATENFSPEQLALYNQNQQTKALAGQQGGKLLAGANYGSVPTAQALGDESSGLTGQFMKQWLAGTEPFFKTQQDQLQTQLENQGLSGPTINNPSGSPAYATALRQLQTNQDLAVAQQFTAAQNQAWNQAVQGYTLPAQMALQLSQFGAPTTPNASFNQGPSIQPADYAAMLSATLPTYMQPYGAQYQQYGNLMAGLFGLGGAGVKGLMMPVGGGVPA